MRAIMMLVSLAVCAPALASGAEGEEKKKERRICKSSPETTTRMGSSRKCMTAAEWKALSDSPENDVEFVKRFGKPSEEGQRPQ